MYKVTIETSDHNNQKNFASPPLLSELYIKLPKPQSTPRKPNLLFAQQDEYQESPNQYQLSPPQSKQNENTNNISVKTDSNCFIFSGTRTKNSSASLPFRSQSEIITQWVRSLFQKKGLLGTHWEQKFKNKRKKQVQEAFMILKQSVEGQCSAYLQTQSLYKPQAKRMNKLLGLGCDKILQILPIIINKHCQIAFSKILRFIAFKHVSNKGSKNEQSPINSIHSINNSLKSSKNNNFNSKNSKEFQIKNEHGHYNVYSTEKNVFKNQDYQTTRSRQLKQVTSLKHLSFNPNQYIMTPVSPIAQYQPTMISEAKKVIRNINQSQFPNQQKFIHTRQSPNLQFNHKIPINNDYLSLERSKQLLINNNPPSPKAHQFTSLSHQNCVSTPQNFDFEKLKQKSPMNMLSFDNIRQSKLRPHSHNPFSSKNLSKQTLLPQNNELQKIQNRKSRAISSSPNIKISFIAQPITPNPHKMTLQQKMNDYEAENIARSNKNNLYKFGTLENRQMRQSYQANSIQNELVNQGQNQFRINPINYAFSSPVTPRAVPNMMQFQTIRVNPPSPTTQYVFTPQEPLRQQKSKPFLRIQPNDYYLKKRQKLMVTSSNKRRY